MEKLNYKPVVRKILADTVTPVSIYLRLRTLYPKAILLESSDYHGNENSYSFICFSPVASFTVDNGKVTKELPGDKKEPLSDLLLGHDFKTAKAKPPQDLGSRDHPVSALG